MCNSENAKCSYALYGKVQYGWSSIQTPLIIILKCITISTERVQFTSALNVGERSATSPGSCIHSQKGHEVGWALKPE
jgi:hypothetical protein